MNKQAREAYEQKQEALQKRDERLQQILREEPNPNAPAVTPMTIEEQFALGIPLDTGWVATMPLPGRTRDRAKKERSP
jgi:hypothetical protein